MLVVDIGNSRASFGAFVGDTLRSSFHIKARSILDKDSIDEQVFRHLNESLNFDPLHKFKPTRIFSSSVNPGVDKQLEKSISDYFAIPVTSLRWDMKKNITLDIKNPETLGLDRISNCIAAYQENKSACIIVDMGSAITVDYVNDQGVFKGGIITPGPRVMLKALLAKAPHLPAIDLEESDVLIGNNTVSAIKSGAYYGVAAMVEGLIERIAKQHDEHAKVILTGGFSDLYSAAINNDHEVDLTLTLRGIKYFADFNQ